MPRRSISSSGTSITSNTSKLSAQEDPFQNVPSENTPLETEKYFKCFYCDYKTKTTVDDLRKHILTHKSIECNGRRTRLVSIKAWTKGSRKRYKCKKCDFQTNVLFNCKRHYRYIHQDGSRKQLKSNEKATKRYKCARCHYRTDLKNSLRRHARHIHDEEVPFDCQECKKGFPSKHALDVHMESAHAKNFKCPDCLFQTNYKASLLQHMRFMHSAMEEDEIHRCELCDFQTKYPLSFQRHVSRHQNDKKDRKRNRRSAAK